MIEVNSVWFMVLWELVLLLIAVDVAILVRFVIRRRREKASIERLVALVRRDEERRKKETRNLLEKKYGYSDEKLEKTTKKIIREEKRIYQMLANLFTTRDNLAIENLSIAFEEAVEPYRTLDLPRIVEESDVGGEEKDNNAEAKRLKEQNQRLSDELKITMNTISRMLHEYSNIAPETGADEEKQDAVAELIINNHTSEDPIQETVVNDAASEAADTVSTGTTEQEVEESIHEEGLDNSALASMFQEEDAADALAEEIDVSAVVFEEESESEAESEAENSRSAAVVSDQDIDEMLGGEGGVDLAGRATEEEGGKATAVEIDPVEDLISQAINQTLESHETSLPEPEKEVAADPIDELLSQVANEAVKSSETEQTDASANMSNEDIDSLLQGMVEEVSVK